MKSHDPIRLLAHKALQQFKHNSLLPEVWVGELNDPLDRRFFTQLTQTTMRHWRLLEHDMLAHLSDPQKLPDKVKTLMILGICQLRFLNKIKQHAAIYETVQLLQPLKLSSFKGLVNGVLRNHQRKMEEQQEQPELTLGLSTSHPEWMVERWQRFYGGYLTRSICENNNRSAPVCLAVLPPHDPQLVEKELQAQGIEVQRHTLAPAALQVDSVVELLTTTAFQQGQVMVQDASSQLFMQLLSPHLQGSVLDVCAAPGGKAAHLLTHPEVELCVLNESQANRVKLIQENLQRLGLSAPLLISDGRQLPLGKQMDVILLDVPCSSTGTIRKSPDIKWVKNQDILLSKVPLQRQLLQEAAQHIKPQGRLIYATCSLEPEENEHQMEWFLKAHNKWKLEPFKTTQAQLQSLIQANGCMRILPSEHAMGFFAAMLRSVP